MLIGRLRKTTGLPIRHVWHEDRGFRKCIILNRATEAAEGDYLVFSDGDCIPRPDFVAQHVGYAKPGQFLSGGVVRLPLLLSQRITIDDVLDGGIFCPATLLARGMRFTRKLRFLARKPWLVWILERLSQTRATFNGCNSSAWKTDVVRVNGFDERMHYGGLDRELGERLINAGIRPRSIRHRTTCLHLDHERSYADPALIASNRRLREETRRLRRTWTPFGLSQHNTELPISFADGIAWRLEEDETILPFPRHVMQSSSSQSPANKRAA